MKLEEGSDFPMPDAADAEPLKKMLSREPFAPIAAEYKRVAKNSSRRVKWYSLFGGPTSLKDLARELGDLRDYLMLYEAISKTVHATDLRRQLTRTDEGAPAVRVIRSPIGLPYTYVLGIGIGIEASKAVIAHYRLGEFDRFMTWYWEKVEPGAEMLNRIKEE